MSVAPSTLHLRLCYFYGTNAKIKVLENVCTGAIPKITESILSEENEWRTIVTEPAETCPSGDVFALSSRSRLVLRRAVIVSLRTWASLSVARSGDGTLRWSAGGECL